MLEAAIGQATGEIKLSWQDRWAIEKRIRTMEDPPKDPLFARALLTAVMELEELEKKDMAAARSKQDPS